MRATARIHPTLREPKPNSAQRVAAKGAGCHPAPVPARTPTWRSSLEGTATGSPGMGGANLPFGLLVAQYLAGLLGPLQNGVFLR